MKIQNKQLTGLKIQSDYYGNLYVCVPVENDENRVIYTVVYLSVVNEPVECENSEQRYFRNI